jgi:1,4-alpha-glucan branching enzyme
MNDITFSFRAPEARCVRLIGDFTQWQRQPIGLKRRTDGLWQVHLNLAPGSYDYTFLVDDKWREDGHCRVRVPGPAMQVCGEG